MADTTEFLAGGKQLSAPKFNTDNGQHQRQIVRYKTICKKIIIGSDGHSQIEKLVYEMEQSGADYYDCIRINTNEMTVIFKQRP